MRDSLRANLPLQHTPCICIYTCTHHICTHTTYEQTHSTCTHTPHVHTHTIQPPTCTHLSHVYTHAHIYTHNLVFREHQEMGSLPSLRHRCRCPGQTWQDPCMPSARYLSAISLAYTLFFLNFPLNSFPPRLSVLEGGSQVPFCGALVPSRLTTRMATVKHG